MATRSMNRLQQQTVLIFLLILHCTLSRAAEDSVNDSTIKRFGRSSFPKGFVFGTASSSYQYEGAVAEGGRKPSIWDVFAHIPGTVFDGTNGDVAVDQYHRYKEDVGLMKDLGSDAYRLSISWSRVLPEGKGKINWEGVKYYNRLIDNLLSKKIQPYVTLHHWDTPQALDVAYKSWLSPKIVPDFAAFADTCFKLFGDRVKNWITFNEPHIFTNLGYNYGFFAPGRCSIDVRNCTTAGNSSTEPYIVGHHLLLSHAAAVKIYRTKYMGKQYGRIGIVFDAVWHEPFSNSFQDRAAAKRGLDFNLGWFMDPVIFGEYPATMRSRVGARLPKFSKIQSESVKGSADFIGINHYSSIYDAAVGNPDLPPPPVPDFTQQAYFKDTGVKTTDTRNGKLIGQNVFGFYIVPEGMKKLLDYIRVRYNNPTIIITENGIPDTTNSSSPLKEVLNDTTRINYLSNYLTKLHAAMRDGSDVRGYFVWSLLDNFEWINGLNVKFGLYHIDYKNNLKRIPKKSAAWYKQFLRQ